jgi:hypothetical protein
VRLRRSVLSCLLWESEFYEDGQTIADRIGELARLCRPADVAALAVEARGDFNLRHAPLMLLDALAETGSGTPVLSETMSRVIQRADELTEFLAIYWRKGKRPLSAQIKKGLAKAFTRFDAYQLAKYDRANSVRLRDVLFLSHAKPKDDEQAQVWRNLVNGTLASPDTWEVGLSTGGDKKETFTRLLSEGKLGYLALLRNLRNMVESGVDLELIRSALRYGKGQDRVLPFRYVAAARACPQLEPDIDDALCRRISGLPPLPGRTAILVDVSGSMGDRLSARSDMSRMDAACALASVINGEIRVFSFSDEVVEVTPRRGMAGVDAVANSQDNCGTYLGAAIQAINTRVPCDRLIVITDEQSHDRVTDPVAERAYMINVASNRNGVGYGRWMHIDGFSERVLTFIHEMELETTVDVGIMTESR